MLSENMPDKRHGRKLRRFAGAALLGLGLCGCSHSWDEITSREFHFKNMFDAAPEPLVVLKEDKDGDHRAKALRALGKPRYYEGPAGQREEALQYLMAAAVTDPHPLCRICAIQSLGKYKDPRSVDALKQAYYQAPPLAGTFQSEVVARIQCQALTALGETHHPSAVDFLVQAVKQPQADNSEQDRQQTLDIRIAAARALGNYSHYQATEALVQVLETDRDVALRDRAHESLREATGKDLPPDPKAWDNLIHTASFQKPQGESNREAARGSLKQP